MMFSFLLIIESMNPTVRFIFIFIFFLGIGLVVLSRFYVYFEQVYARKYGKPFFKRSYIIRSKLDNTSKSILRQNFPFYNRLSLKEQAQFEHRVSVFIREKKFVFREGLIETPDKKVLISATAVMLTFGFRDYLIDLVSNIVVYPKEFYSKMNDQYHKGEFNPNLQTLVLSWKDFLEGYDVSNDNLNVGVHEFAHAIHLNTVHNSGVNSIIFNGKYIELVDYLSKDENLKKEVIDSKYFREYAFTNQFEFVAVLIENFIETPAEFRSYFPEIYTKIKQMLNFNFAGY